MTKKYFNHLMKEMNRFMPNETANNKALSKKLHKLLKDNGITTDVEVSFNLYYHEQVRIKPKLKEYSKELENAIKVIENVLSKNYESVTNNNSTHYVVDNYNVWVY